MERERLLNYYSDNKKRVATKATSLMRGLQDQNIIAVANHFSDPVTIQTKDDQNQIESYTFHRLDTVESFPYEQLIQHGIKGVHTSYLHFSSADKKQTLPPALSTLFISDVIRTKLNFNGLTFTEVPYLRAYTKKPRPGEAGKLAFELGNDFLIDPEQPGAATRKIIKAVKKNKNLMRMLDESVGRILSSKYDAGLANYKPSNTDNLYRKLTTPEAKLLQQRIGESAATLLKNDVQLLPIQILDNRKFLFVSVGGSQQNELNKYLDKYVQFERISIQSYQDTIGLFQKIKANDVIVIGMYPMASTFHEEIVSFFLQPEVQQKTAMCLFSNPLDLKNIEDFPTIIIGYSIDEQIQRAAAQIIFGGLPAKGIFPFTVSENSSEGMGVTSNSMNRLGYSLPEDVGMDSHTLEQIRAIAREAIDSGATPGCHVLVARKGKVVYDQSFGWYTYDNQQSVSDQTIYDLASITKVSATLQTVMFMHDWGLIDIHKKISVYLPELKNTNKEEMTIYDILTHQAGLWPFLPFWTQTITDSSFMSEYYSSSQDPEYPFPVSENLFARKTMKDSLWQWIINSRVRTKTDRTPFDYRYSDMGFYILQHLAEKMLNQPMEDFLAQNLYEPLGASTTGYLPLSKFKYDQVAPTEDDRTFRRSLLTGYVHDQGAAMHGGVAGHAGLFSNATDLAKLGQLWLQQGNYGGIQFFKPETISLFTSKIYEPSRRGLGWDKPTVSDWSGPTTLYASSKTFGHTGFTGTSIWVDPEFDLVFVFLSNRVYPDMNNTKLLTLNIRPRIQEVVYKSIFSYSLYTIKQQAFETN
ncbi:MAG: serine hydrolase [Flammeovirgaceae bacterium]|nr:serine hydrolase [Flammeovirgaceae bacterium]